MSVDRCGYNLQRDWHVKAYNRDFTGSNILLPLMTTKGQGLVFNFLQMTAIGNH